MLNRRKEADTNWHHSLARKFAYVHWVTFNSGFMAFKETNTPDEMSTG